MYKKAHAAIRADPVAKKAEKKPFKGKRYDCYIIFRFQIINNVGFLDFVVEGF